MPALMMDWPLATAGFHEEGPPMVEEAKRYLRDRQAMLAEMRKRYRARKRLAEYEQLVLIALDWLWEEQEREEASACPR